jgi:hypothetical protein
MPMMESEIPLDYGVDDENEDAEEEKNLMKILMKLKSAKKFN